MKAAFTVRALLAPERLCRGLDLMERAQRQAQGFLVRCPVHSERTPSCSVTVGPDGTARVRCFGCDFSGDALTLIAAARGLSLRTDFSEVLAVGAEIGGDVSLAYELRAGRAPSTKLAARPAPQVVERPYPPADEVRALWDAALAVEADADAWEYLRGRGIDPAAVDRAGIARALPLCADVPGWAWFRGESWTELGYRLVVPMFDACGTLRSLRGWKIENESSSSPKRLPPGGFRAGGLAMVNRLALLMLRRRACPLRLVVVEGEPDFLSRCTVADDAVLGIVSGTWTRELANAVPSRTQVVIRTHSDGAGKRYGDAIAESLQRRCAIWRTAA